jgi:hypothetical protein
MMTRRMLAAISVLALALFPGTATAQITPYNLSLTDASGIPGVLVDVQVMFDNNGSNVEGWSFDVAHDPSMVTLIDVVDGSTTATVNNGSPPSFSYVLIYPDAGFTVAAIICFAGCAGLPGGSLNNELYIATYQLNGTVAPGSSSQVEFVEAVRGEYNPSLVVVDGAAVIPTTADGTISIIDCTDTPAPPTNLTCVIDTISNCQCQAQLEWQAPTSLINYYEIYVDGLLATTVSQGATSAVIPLPSSGTSEICIASRCQDIFSTSICCTVECNLGLDCNNNGVPDLCDREQGALDCDGNGVLDSCDLENGVPDSDGDGIIDPCDPICPATSGATLQPVPQNQPFSDGVSCNTDGLHADCMYYRAFDLCENYGIGNNIDIKCLTTVLISNPALETQPMRVRLNIDSDSGAVGPLSSMTMFYEEEFQVPVVEGDELYSFILGTGIVDPDGVLAGSATTVVGCLYGESLVVEIFTPDGQAAGNSLYMGIPDPAQTTVADQIGASYIRTPACGLNDPIDMVNLGYPTNMWIMDVAWDDAGLCGCGDDADADGIPDECDIDQTPGPDCDTNGVLDACQPDSDSDGTIDPCDDDIDGDGIPNDCDIDQTAGSDCNGNGSLDSCDLNNGAPDCNTNGIPDFCDFDCDYNGVPDDCDIAGGAADCDGDGILDSCEIAAGTAIDCDGNGQPDDCEIAAGTGFDCDLDGTLDVCKGGLVFDCNNNGVPDECDLLNGTSFDCNNNGFLDDCEIAQGFADDCDLNGIPDECDLVAGAPDCDLNSVPDVCQIDSDSDGTIDPCDDDLDGDGFPNACDIDQTAGSDCDLDGQDDSCQTDTDSDGTIDPCDDDIDGDGIPNDCDIDQTAGSDCDADGQDDGCQTDTDSDGTIDPCDDDIDGDGILNECDLDQTAGEDCNENGILDSCDIAGGAADADGNGIPDECEETPFSRGDANADGGTDIGDAVATLDYLFTGGTIPCDNAADSNDDGTLNIADAIALLSYLFSGASAPPAPFPDCGIDPTVDALECESFGGC